jgi:hypothetical protein
VKSSSTLRRSPRWHCRWRPRPSPRPEHMTSWALPISGPRRFCSTLTVVEPVGPALGWRSITHHDRSLDSPRLGAATRTESVGHQSQVARKRQRSPLRATCVSQRSRPSLPTHCRAERYTSPITPTPRSLDSWIEQ